MKKAKCILAISLALTMGVIQTSCIGSFSLTQKVLSWNNGLGNKWINELVFLVFWIVPVYELSIFVDGIVLNTIEFWTGSNPFSMNAGEVDSQIVEKDGNVYEITASQNKFEFTQLEGAQKGTKGAFVFDTETQSWAYEK